MIITKEVKPAIAYEEFVKEVLKSDEKKIDLEVKSVDELFKFSTDKGKAETVVMIPIKRYFKFPESSFHVRDDEKMLETIASIKSMVFYILQ